MSLFDQTFCRDQDTPPTADDPTGIRAWAWACGISEDLAFALACSILTGVAGPSFAVNIDMAGPVQPGLSLVARQGDLLLEVALGQLTQGLFRSQTWLLEKSGDFSVDSLLKARFEGRKSRQDEELQQIENHRSVGTSSSLEPGEQLRADVQAVKEATRMEALVRPAFLLSGTLSPHLLEQAKDCHGGYGFYCGTPGPLPRVHGSRDRMLDQFQKLLLGTSVPCGNTKYPTPADTREVFIRGVFRFADGDLEFLMRERRDLLAQTLMVGSEPGVVDDPDPARQQSKYELSEQFIHRFCRVSQLCLANRRAGQITLRGFMALGPLREFNRQQQAYLRELGQHPYAPLTHQAARLPALLAWTFALLVPGYDLDEYLLATVLPIARRLTEAALLPWELADQSSVISDRKRLAAKLIERLGHIQPCKIRELIRGFDRQSKDLFTPVIDTLLSHGIMEQSPDKNLRLGQVPLSKLEVRKLLPPRDR